MLSSLLYLHSAFVLGMACVLQATHSTRLTELHVNDQCAEYPVAIYFTKTSSELLTLQNAQVEYTSNQLLTTPI